ncbi:MAG TPA: GNAT family N-acetyltransferase [Solirubrobacteraceae bacterium]|nr:GNAT family N-acetyltransferase [Solirubrobacteraceae bacterium]
MRLRRAGAEDAGPIAGIAVRAWWHSHRDFVSAQALAERTVEAQTARWAARLAEPEREVWVAVAGGRVAGYAAVGPCADPDAAPASGSLDALYVDPPAQGAGLGTHLLQHAVARLRARGLRRATLWVFEQNDQARAFYERHGWVLDPDGAGNEPEAWDEPAVRYRLC